jgi:hypothetical protein
MNSRSPGNTAGPMTLLFQAPPAPPEEDTDDVVEELAVRPTDNRGGTARGVEAGAASRLRMLKGARAAAAGMHISDAQIRAVLDDPQDVQPDPSQPTRTRLSRDGVVVTTGNDGMILRVARRR